jgi:hypothetical protein
MTQVRDLFGERLTDPNGVAELIVALGPLSSDARPFDSRPAPTPHTVA